MRGRRFMPIAALGLAALAGLVPHVAAGDAGSDQEIPQPIRPGVGFEPAEFDFIHSSTHLQGEPDYTKHAAGLFWYPSSPSDQDISGFRSAVIVDNTSQTSVANVTIQFYDTAGVLLATVSRAIPPEGYIVEKAAPLAAGNGLGSAVISSDTPIVGGTIHHTESVDLTPFGGGVVFDPDPHAPGATSMQQLQLFQDEATTLSMGPFPYSSQDPGAVDFHEGNAPLAWIRNPNSYPVNVTITPFSRLSGALPPTSVTIPAQGSYLDKTIWNLALPIYLTTTSCFDDDIFLYVQADGPIIGEALLTDFFGTGVRPLPGEETDPEPEPICTLVAGDRFRMGSTMFSHAPAARLIGPEVTIEPSHQTLTTIGIANASATSTGWIVVQFRNRNGVVFAGGLVPPLNPGESLRLGPGQPHSPWYPTGSVFDGWVEILDGAAGPSLVGWTMRSTEPNSVFRKAWGEALVGANGREPGPGYLVNGPNGDVLRRKLGPITRVDNSWYWPGYTAIVNDLAATTGGYNYTFFTSAGTNAGTASFAGLPLGYTSLTYEDPLVTITPPGPWELSVAEEHSDLDTVIQGVDTIGDPMREWSIFK